MAPSNAPVTTGTVAGVANPSNTDVRRTSAAQIPVRRRIEPVIPLTYMRRPRPKVPTAPSQLPAPSSPLRNHDTESIPSTPKQNHKEPPQPRPDPVVAVTNGSKLVEEAPTSPQKSNKDNVSVTALEADIPLAASRSVTLGPQTQDPPTQSQTAGEITPPDTAPSAPSSASFPPPTLSPPPNMRPTFHPASNGHFRGPVPDPIRLPSYPLNQPRMHQHHPSNGSLVFGGFHGSNTSSPVPHSGGAFPPPMPTAHEQVPITSLDSFGRPMVSTAPIDTHAPGAINHAPLTPHSFHGSQSSRNEDFSGKPPLVNGINGVDVPRPGPPPSASRPPYYPNNQPPFNPDGFEVGEAMGFAEYISSMFARPEFADCEVVLVIPDRLTSVNSQYPGMPNGPLRLPAHQLVLSHHPMLRKMVHEIARQGDGPREVCIVSDDPFLRADAMWRAIKYLYGCRYVPLPLGLDKESDVEKFHFALGYAAAGARLEVPHISITAAREASKLLSWDTAEKGLEFALTGMEIHPDRMHVPHALPQFRYKHGVYVGELVEKIMMFLITHFPNNFALDTTVEDPRYSRLPPLPTRSEDQRGRKTSSQNFHHGGQPPSRVASINIKFGDMDPSETNGLGHNGFLQHPGGHLAALSRILLNLPFEMLKVVLESNGLGGVSGWQTVQDRRRVMSDVIAEREARRLRFIGELAAGRYRGPAPTDGLRSNEPRLLEGTWSNVCWKEECLPTGDVPMMGRVWAPLDIS